MTVAFSRRLHGLAIRIFLASVFAVFAGAMPTHAATDKLPYVAVMSVKQPAAPVAVGKNIEVWVTLQMRSNWPLPMTYDSSLPNLGLQSWQVPTKVYDQYVPNMPNNVLSVGPGRGSVSLFGGYLGSEYNFTVTPSQADSSNYQQSWWWQARDGQFSMQPFTSIELLFGVLRPKPGVTQSSTVTMFAYDVAIPVAITDIDGVVHPDERIYFGECRSNCMFSASIAMVPEPSAALLALIGVLVILGVRRTSCRSPSGS